MEPWTKFQKTLKIKQYVQSVDSLNETPKRAKKEATGVKFKLRRRLDDVADVNTETPHDKTYDIV